MKQIHDIFKERRRKLARTLKNRKLDAFLATSPESRFYLSNFRANDLNCRESSGLLLVLNDEMTYLFTDRRYEEEAHSQTNDINVIIYKNIPHRRLTNLLKRNHIENIAYESSSISNALFNKIKSASSVSMNFYPRDSLIFDMRMVKDEIEINNIKRAVRVGETVLEKALLEIAPGMTEREASWIILKYTYQLSEGPSFPPIVASGPNSSLPHATPSERVIRENEPVIIDIGVFINGYASDMTRTIFWGNVPSRFKTIYRCVKEAKEAAQKRIKADCKGSDIDRISRDYLNGHGLGKYFSHALGHGVGLSVHEYPLLSHTYAKRLLPYSIVTVEPGVYIPKEGGVRLEDMALILENGIELLGSNKFFYEF